MVVIGVLLIVAVVLDAVRRVRSERYSRNRVKQAEEAVADIPDEELFWPKELPNGGARVVDRGDPEYAVAQPSPAAELEDTPAAPQEAEQAEDPLPVAARDADDVTLLAGFSAVEPESTAAPEPARPAGAGQSQSAEPEPVDAPAAGMDTPETLDWLDNLDDDVEPPIAEEPARLPRGVEPEVFMLNVVSRRPEGFRGEDILHILLACDLRFGDMNFFHRHEFEAGRGAIQFSVANMMQPGVFDIDNMADFNTPGLVFFVTLPGPEDMMKAFDYMLETAQAVARNLDGDVLDESRSAITRQTLEHCRQQIRDLERRMLARAPEA